MYGVGCAILFWMTLSKSNGCDLNLLVCSSSTISSQAPLTAGSDIHKHLCWENLTIKYLEFKVKVVQLLFFGTIYEFFPISCSFSYPKDKSSAVL